MYAFVMGISTYPPWQAGALESADAEQRSGTSMAAGYPNSWMVYFMENPNL